MNAQQQQELEALNKRHRELWPIAMLEVKATFEQQMQAADELLAISARRSELLQLDLGGDNATPRT